MNEIQKIRKKTGLSQSGFAEHFNIPIRTIQKWEIGQATPPHYLIQMMKQILIFEQKESIKKNTTIPDSLKNLFWDCSVEKLDLMQNSDFIIARLYNLGGVFGRMWVEMYYSPEQIKRAACSRRDFDPIVANYLSKEFKIAKENMKYYQYIAQESDWQRRNG